jgi:cell division septum initiation protein DivIVA
MGMVAGVSDNDPLETVRMMLADPKGLQQKLDQLKEAQNQAQAVLDLVGPAREILKLREEANRLREKADSILLLAQKEADSLKAQAQDEMRKMVALTNQKARDQEAELKLVEVEKKELKAQTQVALGRAKRLEADAADELKKVLNSAKVLEEAQKATDLKQDELDQRLGQLEKAQASLKLLLG